MVRCWPLRRKDSSTVLDDRVVDVTPKEPKSAPWLGRVLSFDQLALLALVPIITGYVAFVFFSRKARLSYKDILALVDGSSKLTRVLTTGYIYFAIALGVFIVAALAYVLIAAVARLLHRRRSKQQELQQEPGGPVGDESGVLVLVPSKRQRTAFRASMLLLLAVQALAFITAFAIFAIWLWLYASALVLKASVGAGQASVPAGQPSGLGLASPAQVALLSDALSGPIAANSSQGQFIAGQLITFGDLKNISSTVQQCTNGTLAAKLSQASLGGGNATFCPGTGVNLAYWGSLIKLNVPQNYLCDPEAITTLYSTVDSLETQLLWSWIGAAGMAVAWVVLLMRLAAVWQSAYVRVAPSAPVVWTSNPVDAATAPETVFIAASPITPPVSDDDEEMGTPREHRGNESFASFQSARSFVTAPSFGNVSPLPGSSEAAAL